MDPQASLRDFFWSCEDMTHIQGSEDQDVEDRENIRADALEALKSLVMWIEKGGYLPDARHVAKSFLDTCDRLESQREARLEG